jgi:hypothetical protein
METVHDKSIKNSILPSPPKWPCGLLAIQISKIFPKNYKM